MPEPRSFVDPACRCEIVDPRPTDVVYRRGAEVRAEARSIFGLHLRLYARPRPASRRSRPAAPLRRQPRPPSTKMVLTLERDGLIRRQPGVPRSIEVLLAPELLPILR